MTAHTGCLADEALVDAILDAAPGRTPGALADHRARCERCDARARAWERTLDLLRADPLASDPPVPAGLHESIMDAVARTPLLVDAPRRSWWRALLERPLRTAWAGAAASMALVVIAVVGLRGPVLVQAPDRVWSNATTIAEIASIDDVDGVLLGAWSSSPEGEAVDIIEAASSLTSEQADWVVRELQRRLGG